MSVVSDSEKQDFCSLIADAGFEANDFELQETEDVPHGTIYAIRGRVSIRRKSTGAVRDYPAGHMTAWLGDFDRDLRGGEFGKS